MKTRGNHIAIFIVTPSCYDEHLSFTLSMLKPVWIIHQYLIFKTDSRLVAFFKCSLNYRMDFYIIFSIYNYGTE